MKLLKYKYWKYRVESLLSSHHFLSDFLDDTFFRLQILCDLASIAKTANRQVSNMVITVPHSLVFVQNALNNNSTLVRAEFRANNFCTTGHN